MKLFAGHFILFFSLVICSSDLRAQMPRTYESKDSIIVYPPGCYQKFDAKKFIAPAAMIAYGFAALHIDGLTDFSEKIQEETWVDHPHDKTTIDNYLQFAPAVAVYALNLAGIKGEHNFVDRSMIYLMSNLIMEGFVTTIKNWSHIPRPTVKDTSRFLRGIPEKRLCPPHFCMKNIKMYPSGMAWAGTWLQERLVLYEYITTHTGCTM